MAEHVTVPHVTNPLKVAIVTGAGSGIGKGVALALLRRGYAVALAGGARRCSRRPWRNRARTPRAGSSSPTDVGDAASVRRLFEATRGAFGRLDLLFNNAGGNAPGVAIEDLRSSNGRRSWTSTSPARSCARSRRFC